MKDRTTAASVPRGYQQVAGRISRYIVDNKLTPGSRLPGEIDLANILGVSRTVIREAMVAMEVAGEIDVRNGSGAYVCESPNLMSRALGSGPGPFELLRARHLIEGEIAADAALFASTTDLIALETTLTQMRRLVLSKYSVQAIDREFHVLIGKAAKNTVLADIVNGLWASMFAPGYHQLTQNCASDQHQSAALKDHEAIFAAIAKRDPTEARRTMRRHLYRTEEYLASDPPLPVSSISPPPNARVGSFVAVAIH